MFNSEKIYVIAGNNEQFNQFRATLAQKMIDAGLTVYSQEIVYISTAERLRGLRNIHGYKVGTWQERSDIFEIEQQLKIIESANNFIEIDWNFYVV